MVDKALCPICTSSNLDYSYSDITCGNCGRSRATDKFFLLPNEPEGDLTYGEHQEGKSYVAQMYMKNLHFGKAIDCLKAGNKVKLPHWQDDVYLELQVPDINSKMTAPYIYVVSRFGLVPWVATQVEMLSEEWVVLG